MGLKSMHYDINKNIYTGMYRDVVKAYSIKSHLIFNIIDIITFSNSWIFNCNKIRHNHIITIQFHWQWYYCMCGTSCEKSHYGFLIQCFDVGWLVYKDSFTTHRWYVWYFCCPSIYHFILTDTSNVFIMSFFVNDVDAFHAHWVIYTTFMQR